MTIKKVKKEKYYEVLINGGNGHWYKGGFTSNKSAYQRNSGHKMKDLKFKVLYRIVK